MFTFLLFSTLLSRYQWVSCTIAQANFLLSAWSCQDRGAQLRPGQRKEEALCLLQNAKVPKNLRAK